MEQFELIKPLSVTKTTKITKDAQIKKLEQTVAEQKELLEMMRNTIRNILYEPTSKDAVS